MLRTNDHMRQPYILHFSESPILKESVVGRLPDWCRFSMPIASEAVHYQFSKADILSQRLRRRHFFVDILEIHTRSPYQLKFKVEEDQLFLLFMLEGCIEFSTTDGRYITEAKKNYFYLSHNGPGTFKATMAPGKHVAFVVAIKASWAKKIFKEFSNLDCLIQLMLESPQPYTIMPHCRMDKQVHEWLREVNSTTKTNIVVLDSIFRMYITLVLEYYNDHLTAGEGMLAYKVKQYLDKHYTDHDIGYEKLAAMYYVTVRTLSSQFKAAYHMTIHDYYTGLRIKKAKHMIETLKMPVSEVYFIIGYNNESTFRYAYNKFKAQK